MINVNELRMGNWIIVNDKLIDKNAPREPYYYQIGSFDIWKIDSFDPGEENGVQPVPLTPEIFEACSFAEDDDPYVTKWFNEDIGYIARCEGGFTFPDSDGEPSINYAITSLHQLQNYYFAIMGKELTVNLAKTIPA